jgi:hypothetical protein
MKAIRMTKGRGSDREIKTNGFSVRSHWTSIFVFGR